MKDLIIVAAVVVLVVVEEARAMAVAMDKEVGTVVVVEANKALVELKKCIKKEHQFC